VVNNICHTVTDAVRNIYSMEGLALFCAKKIDQRRAMPATV